MLPAEAATEEQLFDVAVGAGAEEVEQIGQSWVITTPKEQLDEIRGALDGAEKELSPSDATDALAVAITHLSAARFDRR